MSAQSKVKRPTYAQLRAQLVVMTAERDDLKRRFPNTFCSQCGGEFGPGDHEDFVALPSVTSEWASSDKDLARDLLTRALVHMEVAQKLAPNSSCERLMKRMATAVGAPR